MNKFLFARLAAVPFLAAIATANTVADDSTDQAAVNISTAATYRVHNSGNDNNIVAVARNSSNEIVAWINVKNGASSDIGVPAGGSLTIDDNDYSGSQTAPTVNADGNTNGSSYTYTTV